MNGDRSDNIPRPPTSPGARSTDPGTSWGAAQAHPASRSKLRALVLELHQANPAGLTDDELCQLAPDQHPGSVAKRRHDLLAAGELVDSGRRRRTRFDCWAVVWCVAEPETPAGEPAQLPLPLPSFDAGAMAATA